MPRAVVFDLDDTLIASTPGYLATMRRTAAELGLAEPDVQASLRPFSSWREAVEALFPDVSFVKFSQHYQTLVKEIPYRAVDGAVEALEALRHNRLLGIVTNRERRLCALRMEQAGISAQLFDFIFTAEDLPAAKPHPRSLEPAFKALNGHGRTIQAQDVIYVGDRVQDGQAAQGAGSVFVGVLTGVDTASDFSDAGFARDTILSSVRELPTYLAKRLW